MKEKQDQDPIFLDLKASVHKQKVLTFQQREDGVLKYQEYYVYLWWMDSKRESWTKLTALYIPFIKVLQICIAIGQRYIDGME